MKKLTKQITTGIVVASILTSPLTTSHASSSRIEFKYTSETISIDSTSDRLKMDWKKVSGAQKYNIHIRNLNNNQKYVTSSKKDYYKLKANKVDIKEDCKVRIWVEALDKRGDRIAQGKATYRVDMEMDREKLKELEEKLDYYVEKANRYLDKADRNAELANEAADELLQDTVSVAMSITNGNAAGYYVNAAKGMVPAYKTGKETVSGLYYIGKAVKYINKAKKVDKQINRLKSELGID